MARHSSGVPRNSEISGDIASHNLVRSPYLNSNLKINVNTGNNIPYFPEPEPHLDNVARNVHISAFHICSTVPSNPHKGSGVLWYLSLG